MALPIKQVRPKMEKMIYDFFDSIDPSGANTRKFKEFFGKMNDAQFKAYFDNFCNDPNAFLIMDMVGYEHEPDMESVKKTAKKMGVPLFEHVIQPNVADRDDKAIMTAKKVPVGYIHLKVMQQMVRKKNTTSTTIDQRDSRTGQVTGDDKDTQFSPEENYSLMAFGAKSCLKEFLSMRADDMVMKQEGYTNIRKNGYVSLADLTDDVDNKVAINTLDVYLTAMHMKSDLVNEGYILNSNLKKKDGE